MTIHGIEAYYLEFNFGMDVLIQLATHLMAGLTNRKRNAYLVSNMAWVTPGITRNTDSFLYYISDSH